VEQIFQLLGHRTDLTRYVLVGSLMVIRLLPVTFLTPFLGGKLVPMETRMSLAVGLTIFGFDHAQAYLSGPFTISPMVYIALLLKELFIGFSIGYIASKLFYAMELGGRILDTMRGSNMAEAQVPSLGFRASPLGDFLFHLLLIVFMGMNGHIYVIEAVLDSFRVVPIDAWPTFSGSFEEWVDLFLHYSSSLFGIAFALTFPGIFASFMVDIVFGMLNRVAPQLNAYQLAMGIKALTGIAFFFFSLSLLVRQLGVQSGETVELIRRMIEMMG